MRSRLASILGAGWALALASPVGGQAGVPSPSGMLSWGPVAQSAAVPGWGQWALGQRRGWAYLAVEAAVWTGYGLSRKAGLDDRTAYRDLAWREARGGVEPRRDPEAKTFI